MVSLKNILCVNYRRIIISIRKSIIPKTYNSFSSIIKAEREAGYSAALDKSGLDLLLQMDEIDMDIAAGLRLREIAQKAGLSESAFSRRFAAVNGISFKQYSIEKKLQRAILLLKTTDLKMIDIAAESGFESVSGFYDAFKKKTGTTPNQFLNE